MITGLCAIKNTEEANIGLAINYNGANQVFAKQEMKLLVVRKLLQFQQWIRWTLEQ